MERSQKISFSIFALCMCVCKFMYLQEKFWKDLQKCVNSYTSGEVVVILCFFVLFICISYYFYNEHVKLL